MMSDRLAGRADEAGTTRYAERHADLAAKAGYRRSMGLCVSSVGLGTYLGDLGPARDRGYAAALEAALRGGINVVDSAINYRHQRSERVVGATLRRLVEAGTVARDEVFVATKGGYIPFDADVRDPRRAVDERYVDRGLLTQDNVVNGVHCMDPEFLDVVVDESRTNLGLDTIDLYHVHNPETQLAVVDRETFRERLLEAFVALERQVDRGAIARYGVATWSGLRVPPEASDHVSLAGVVETAEAARKRVGAGPHHFAAVQAPLNLMMPEAVQRPTQRLPDGRVVPLAAACRALGLAFFTSASILQGRLSKDLPAALVDRVGRVGNHAQVALQATRSATGVSCALVGMSDPRHVEEALMLMRGHLPEIGDVWAKTMSH